MTNSILIGKAIYSQLANDIDTQAYVGANIFPLVAENDTSFPFICYTRENVNGNYGYTKDGHVGEEVQFKVDVVSNSYNESCEIALAVRKCLEKPYIAMTDTVTQNNVQTTVTVLRINDCVMTSINEAYDSETFIQTLRFRCLCA